MSSTYIWLHNRKRFHSNSSVLPRLQPQSWNGWTGTVKNGWFGPTIHIVRVSNMGRMVDFIRDAPVFFFFAQSRLIFQAYVHFKTLILFFKSFHEFFWHNNTFFSSYNFFLIIPFPLPHVKLQSCLQMYVSINLDALAYSEKRKKRKAFYTSCRLAGYE